LFDEQLAPPGPPGPLEQPDSANHSVEIFQSFCRSRERAAEEHVKLIINLASDVGRHVLDKGDKRSFITAAETIILEEFSDNLQIVKYAKSVFGSTLRVI
jgi:hypothetical protein